MPCVYGFTTEKMFLVGGEIEIEQPIRWRATTLTMENLLLFDQWDFFLTKLTKDPICN